MASYVAALNDFYWGWSKKNHTAIAARALSVAFPLLTASIVSAGAAMKKEGRYPFGLIRVALIVTYLLRPSIFANACASHASAALQYSLFCMSTNNPCWCMWKRRPVEGWDTNGIFEISCGILAYIHVWNKYTCCAIMDSHLPELLMSCGRCCRYGAWLDMCESAVKKCLD